MENNKKRCLVVTGPFVPTNDPMTLLPYKQLRLLDYEFDVCALKDTTDNTIAYKLKKDEMFDKFNIQYVGNYQDLLFSIRNINLIKALYNVNKYINVAVKMYNQKKYDLIYTSSFPAYTHRVGRKIKSSNTSIKWVASFTDPINHSPYKFDQETYGEYSFLEKIAFKAYIHFYVDDNDEKIAFEGADILVFICEEQRDFMIEQYLKYFGTVSREQLLEKSVIVPLNYIPEWEEYENQGKQHRENDKFVIGHFGRVYGHRKIKEFIYAVKGLDATKYKDKFMIEQYGEFRKSDLKLIKTLELEKYFNINEKISYDECIQEMYNCDALLIFDTILGETELQPYLPSKIMEYSLLEKNVLGIANRNSPTYRIMNDSGAICSEYNRDEITQGLKSIMDGKKSVINYKYTNETAVRYLIDKITSI